jgi:hypothetical protein
VERIEELPIMAAMNTRFTSSRQKVSAELIASFGAEQRRLKAAAAVRRAAAAAAGEVVDKGFSVRPDPLAVAHHSRYLR